MKSSIRHGGVVRCDMVTVTETKNDMLYEGECDERFVSYSMAAIVREQAANAGWLRPRARIVKWPGQPPVDNSKKVDLCPKHSHLVMSPEELKAKKLADKEKRAAEKLAAKESKPKKPRAPRKKKDAPASP